MVKPRSINRVINQVCHNWSFATNTNVYSGGRIWVMWKSNNLEVDVVEYDAQYIHLHVKVKHTGQLFAVTYVYGFNKIEERIPLWPALIRLYGGGPWVVLVDFNNVLYANERLGKIVKHDEMMPFQSTLNYCDLQDMKSTGAFFTWNNKQPIATRVFSRIDRVLVNSDWITQWPDWSAHFYPEGTFDHCLCIISYGMSGGNGHNKPFKFFNMWTKVPEFHSILEKGWGLTVSGAAMFKLQLQKDPTNKSLIDMERQIRESYYFLADGRDDFLRQKSKCAWAKDGDSNSGLFHQAIRKRQVQNKVLYIENSMGQECKEPIEVLQAFVDYYSDLLGTKAPTSNFYKQVVRQGKLVDPGDWEEMCKVPSKLEIKQALFSIPDDKSPGPDGFTSCFFKAG
ncbi:uncharacterized protein LOC141632182 [Silene latifolia]|uniref:uncharacterized protein LOC141632182 n=1 Tax=Silene latifolia TaxID=37657 RepID=UPI003D7883E4